MLQLENYIILENTFIKCSIRIYYSVIIKNIRLFCKKKNLLVSGYKLSKSRPYIVLDIRGI